MWLSEHTHTYIPNAMQHRCIYVLLLRTCSNYQTAVSLLLHLFASTTQDSLKSLKTERLREHVQQITWPNGHRVILLAEGRQLNHSCSCVPSLVVSVTHATQVQQRQMCTHTHARTHAQRRHTTHIFVVTHTIITLVVFEIMYVGACRDHFDPIKIVATCMHACRNVLCVVVLFHISLCVSCCL